MSTLSSYIVLAGQASRSTEQKDIDAKAISEIGYYRAHIRDVRSLSDFINDQRLFTFAVNAYGIADVDRARDLLRTAESDGVAEALKAASAPSDANYRDFIRTFDFRTFDGLTTQRWEVTDDAVNAYAGRTLLSDPGMQKSLDREANSASVKREVDYFKAHIGGVKSIDDFLADTRLFKFAMRAYGLTDMSYAKAFMKKALTEGIDDKKSFANRLQDSRYRDFVRAFDFKTYGTATTDRWQAKQGTVDAYVRQSLEVDAGADNEGIRLALYFRRKATEINSVYDILADKALSQVVRVALSLPEESARGNVEAQAAAITRKLDLADLKDPSKVDALIRRFATLWDVSADAPAAPIMSLYNPQSQDLDMDLLLKLQSIRQGSH